MVVAAKICGMQQLILKLLRQTYFSVTVVQCLQIVRKCQPKVLIASIFPNVYIARQSQHAKFKLQQREQIEDGQNAEDKFITENRKSKAATK